MSGEDERPEEPLEASMDAPDADAPDSAAMRALLKRSFSADEPKSLPEGGPAAGNPKPAPEGPSLLPGVQKRIRRRSKGKFFADGWSTSQSRVNYALISGIMLVLLAVAYFALGPTGISTP